MQITNHNNGTYSTDVTNGNYSYTVTKDGYNEQTGSVTIANADVTVNVTLIKEETETVRYEGQYNIVETTFLTENPIENTRVVNADGNQAWNGMSGYGLIEDWNEKGFSKINYDDINIPKGFTLSEDRMLLTLQPDTKHVNPYFSLPNGGINPRNRLGIQNHNAIMINDVEKININLIVDVEEPGEHWMFPNADNYYTVNLNGVKIIDRSRQTIQSIRESDTYNFTVSIGFKINLDKGRHVFSIYAEDAGGSPWAMFFAIFRITKEKLIEIHDKYVISNADIIPANNTRNYEIMKACRDELEEYVVFSNWSDIKQKTETPEIGTFNYTFFECSPGYKLTQDKNGVLSCIKESSNTDYKIADFMLRMDDEGNYLDADGTGVDDSGKNIACAINVKYHPASNVGDIFRYNNTEYDVIEVYNSDDMEEFHGIPVKMFFT